MVRQVGLSIALNLPAYYSTAHLLPILGSNIILVLSLQDKDIPQPVVFPHFNAILDSIAGLETSRVNTSVRNRPYICSSVVFAVLFPALKRFTYVGEHLSV